MKDCADALLEQIDEAASAIRAHAPVEPEVAIVLGTGLGNFAKKIRSQVTIPYGDIPHFPQSTAPSHASRLSMGLLGKRRVVAMEGRFHCYEGYSAEEVVFPVRVMRRLGARVLILSNAAGGLNPAYHKGDIVLIEDHINLMGVNPLIGPNDNRLGLRFPDMSQPYATRLLKIAEQAGRETGLALRTGVYVGVTGPNLETRAEYRFLRQIGADLVGMSTIPEVLAGVHAGFEILGLSVVTDVCMPDTLEPVSIEEVIRVANEAGPKLDRLVEAVVAAL